MARVDQYHIHTHIVNKYKILLMPVPMGMKPYTDQIPDEYSYILGTRGPIK
jgi:hypothetical protein